MGKEKRKFLCTYTSADQTETDRRQRPSLYVWKYSRADQAMKKEERQREREREHDGRKAKTINKIAGSEGARARIRRVASVLLARDQRSSRLTTKSVAYRR